jgi:siroheme decarboxylase
MGYHSNTIALSEELIDSELSLTTVDLELLNAYQRGFPLVPRPYAQIAQQLNLEECEVIQRLERLQSAGVVSRIGAVLETGKAGNSTLAAVEVPQDKLERIAALVNQYPEVNHNYEREHTLNLWFVVTASSPERLQRVLSEIEAECQSTVHFLPMIHNFHIDLGFPIG